MENASKALIIAGAILLSILIIGIGMYIYNAAKEVMSSVNLDKYQIQEFNEQFNSYAGNNNGSKAKTLVSDLTANARQYSDDPSMKPYVGLNTDSNDEMDLRRRRRCCWR